MVLQEPKHARELLRPFTGGIVGVGMTAFPRIIPSFFFDSYHIAAVSRTADLPLLRKTTDIFCLEEAGGSVPKGSRNSAALLGHDLTKRYLNRLPDPIHLLLYQNYPDLEDLAGREGWVLLANPADLRLRLRERAFFQQMSFDLDLSQVPGAIQPIGKVLKKDYESWAKDLGQEMVIQLPDIAQGGGRGTFFIRSAQAFACLTERLKEHVWRDVRVTSALVRRFIQGTPSSVAICVTRHGILMSGLQQQLIDLPYCSASSENGIFCGHVWDEGLWPSAVEDAARKQAEKIGEYLAALGYRGIFGIDFIVEEMSGAVYPLEINPRFTGAFPMLSLLHIQNGIIPLDVFHLLEFLNVPYQIDVEELNRRYRAPLRGSHLLLFIPPEGEGVRGLRMPAGLYELGPRDRSLRFVGEGTEYRDIKNENQFIVVDGPPVSEAGEGAPEDSFSRLCHLLFSYPVSDARGTLSPHARLALEWIYGMDDDAP